MALFKYLRRETTMLPDTQAWCTTAKFKFRQYFCGRFGVKPPNFKTTNISGYTVVCDCVSYHIPMNFITKAWVAPFAGTCSTSLVPRPHGRRKNAWYRLHNHSQKKLGIRLRLEIVKSIYIFPYHRKIQPFASRITFNSMNVEDNCRVYKAKDAFLRLLTSFSKSVRYEVLSFACLTVNKANWVQGGGCYIVILLVSPLGPLTIAKFNGLSVHCFVVANFSALYVYYFWIFLSVYYCTWTIYVNVTILRKYNENGRTCASSRYQAVSLLPCGLGMRLVDTSHEFCSLMFRGSHLIVKNMKITPPTHFLYHIIMPLIEHWYQLSTAHTLFYY